MQLPKYIFVDKGDTNRDELAERMDTSEQAVKLPGDDHKEWCKLLNKVSIQDMESYLLQAITSVKQGSPLCNKVVCTTVHELKQLSSTVSYLLPLFFCLHPGSL